MTSFGLSWLASLRWLSELKTETKSDFYDNSNASSIPRCFVQPLVLPPTPSTLRPCSLRFCRVADADASLPLMVVNAFWIVSASSLSYSPRRIRGGFSPLFFNESWVRLNPE